MLYCLFGMLCCYGLFLLYDVNQIRWKRSALNALFFLSLLLMAGMTGAACFGGGSLQVVRLVPGGLCAALFFALLLYTLFFAIPFGASYLDNAGGRLVYRRGMYALCRHPGVLWYAGFYFGLYWAFGGVPLLTLAVAGTVLDVLYAAFQDVWTFPRMFADYGTYKRETPFLLPNGASLRRCMRTLRGEDCG